MWNRSLAGALAGMALGLAMPSSAAAQQPTTEVDIAGLSFVMDGETGPFRITTTSETVEPGLSTATLTLKSDSAATPNPLILRWATPARDMQGIWTTGSWGRKTIGPDWSMSGVTSMFARNAPVLALFGNDDGNRVTIAVSDALNSVRLSAGIREEDATVRGRIELFGERQPPTKRIELRIRVDRRSVPLWESLGEVSEWWAGMPDTEPAHVPEIARLPMYSTWYSYHQELESEALLREVELARELGYEAIIVDDGWQTLDSRRGYAFTGDWRPERIPEMREFVDAVHQRGMKLLLWYAMPLVGEKSSTYPDFRGKYLRYWDGQGAWVLDPRYPEVREHLIGTYRRAMEEWEVDGFKLDFLGFFVATDSTELTVADGRDFASVSEAADRLLTDVMTELRAVNPDVMIEFRQPYIGPLMRKYGNMFRAADAPHVATDNRLRTVDLRLLSGNTAVHSDMFMWHPEDEVEAAALQFLSVLFAVPQLSVRLERIPPDHREMVRHWTDYWLNNRDVLLEGTFVPYAPLANYPLIEAVGDGKRIVALYGDRVVHLPKSHGRRALDLINAGHRSRVIVEVGGSLGRFDYRVFDTMGREFGASSVELSPGVYRFSVPRSGLLQLTPVP
ncbi:MAG: alpha-galactosidase [marine benthic group bacterium]|nr:alpha-galactosidase [Gemmatimonadota bacterium]